MRISAFIAIAFVTGCSSFPQVEGKESERARAAPYPNIVPIEGLLISALGPVGGISMSEAELEAKIETVESRIRRLQAKAELLRGAPVNDDTRARIAAF